MPNWREHYGQPRRAVTPEGADESRLGALSRKLSSGPIRLLSSHFLERDVSRLLRRAAMRRLRRRSRLQHDRLIPPSRQHRDSIVWRQQHRQSGIVSFPHCRRRTSAALNVRARHHPDDAYARTPLAAQGKAPRLRLCCRGQDAYSGNDRQGLDIRSKCGTSPLSRKSSRRPRPPLARVQDPADRFGLTRRRRQRAVTKRGSL